MKKIIRDELKVISLRDDYQSFWCPDREHVFEMARIADIWYIRISIHDVTVKSLSISIKKPELITQAKQLACKHYPSKI
jgi:hypothetical protein